MAIIHTEVIVGTDHMETVSMAPGDATAKKREVVCFGSPDSAGVDKIADIGQSTMANSLPVAIASDQSAVPVSGTVAVSNLPATQPVSAAALPLPAGAATSAKQPALGTAGTPSADVISIQGEAGMTPVKVDGSATTQPVSGTVAVSNLPATQPVSAAALPLPSGAATSAKQPALGTAGTPSADVVTIQGATSMTPVKVDGSGVTQPVSGTVAVSNLPATQPVSAVSLPLPTGAAQDATLTGGTQKTIVRGGQKGTTNTNADITHTPSGANHEAMDTVLYDAAGNLFGSSASPLVNNLTQIGGAALTLGQLLSAASLPVVPASDWATIEATFKALRMTARPFECLGMYSINLRTPTYAGLSAGAPLWSMRWTDVSKLCVLLRVQVSVVVTIAATTAGLTERELIIARGFSVSDTGGTAVTPFTGNNQKRRASQATSIVGDMRTGGPLTAGTRTLDANPIGSVSGWCPLNMTGVVIGGGGGSGATSAAWAVTGGMPYADLLCAVNAQEYAQVLAQNEGAIVRIGKDAMPAGATMQTYISATWAEVNAY